MLGAQTKGLYEWNFDACGNKTRMYRKLAYETNVFVFHEIANQINIYCESCNDNSENKVVITAGEDKTSRKKKAVKSNN